MKKNMYFAFLPMPLHSISNIINTHVCVSVCVFCSNISVRSVEFVLMYLSAYIYAGWLVETAKRSVEVDKCNEIHYNGWPLCVFVLPCVGYFHLSGIILCQQQDMRMFACMLSMGFASLSTYLVKCALRFCALHIYRKLHRYIMFVSIG